ncbi:L,D-transpeptidase [Streptomyces sp. B1866]|uniref:L,D-transpeptidase n=1 Tax=Streptomyces sp. B1866 TaxID=3075431 RepID=UPI00288CE6FE|nr:L,D-transpeptidase [Streptomyces sp. B1866]MDT3397397.1 L,D-transpeptidase [Streptomyces sp. B1866]
MLRNNTALWRRLGASAGAAAVLAPLAVLGPGAASAQAAPARCTATAGPYQKQAEAFLGRRVDGRQSVGDCEAIRTFQRQHAVYPALGYAGPLTWSMMRLVTQQRAALHHPNSDGRCPVNRGRIACVDLTRQISWVQDGRRLVREPVPVRTGRDGYETRTGPHRVYWRHKNHVSTLYDVPMPYSQFFDGGQAFHAISGNVWSQPGSHGCVNMRPGDAAAYWRLLRTGDDVYVYGRKPGT